jgi:hypothetical protein
MEKLTFMQKQLTNTHMELRKVKRFHKQSSVNFKQFHDSMSCSLKLLTKGDIYNDIHYVNIMNMSMIELFTKHVSLNLTHRSSPNQSSTPSYTEHLKLKEIKLSSCRKAFPGG